MGVNAAEIGAPERKLPRLAGPERVNGEVVMLSEKVASAELFEIWSVAVNETLPLKAAVGVPEMEPALEMPRPSGSPEADHRKLLEPPVAESPTGP